MRPDGRLLFRRLRAVRRAAAVLVWTLIALFIQAFLILLPGPPRVMFARLYWAMVCRCLGLRVRLVGLSATRDAGAGPIVFVANHSSWLDVPVLGGRLDACFVAKADVATWPVVNAIARLGRTVFVSRRRQRVGQECAAMRTRLDRGDNLLLFPEGTTSDGSRVLPFRSSFFAIAEETPGLRVQPVSVVYDRLAGLPTGRSSRPLFAWYGDMDLASHFWRLSQYHGLRVTVLLHPPLLASMFPDRKALAQAVWASVADGASSLRQGRAIGPRRPGPGGAGAPRPVGSRAIGVPEREAICAAAADCADPVGDGYAAL